MKSPIHVGMLGILALTAPAAVMLTQPAALHAQAQTVSIHGKVLNPAGEPFKEGFVKLTTDKTSASKDRKYVYSFPVGQDGTYTGTGIAPGDYLLVFYTQDKVIDYQNMVLKGGESPTVDFDMTREEYQKQMSPEDKAALEAYKKKNAGISAENATIKELNAAMTQAVADEKAGKGEDAVASLKSIMGRNPPEQFQAVLYASLGQAQFSAANQAMAAAKAAHTSPQTPEIQAKYLEAAASFQKSMDLNAKASKPQTPENLAIIEMNQGQALALGGKPQDAMAAFDASAKTSPANAGSAYYNEAATFYNSQQLDPAAAAADKAIAADPKRALAYYIKGQALIPKATVDTKTQKIVAPPGCVEAYQEYLELDPNGVHAAEVKDLLTNLGQPIVNSFKAGKKR